MSDQNIVVLCTDIWHLSTEAPFVHLVDLLVGKEISIVRHIRNGELSLTACPTTHEWPCFKRTHLEEIKISQHAPLRSSITELGI